MPWSCLPQHNGQKNEETQKQDAILRLERQEKALAFFRTLCYTNPVVKRRRKIEMRA
jgi:uncharacterized protein YerC